MFVTRPASSKKCSTIKLIYFHFLSPVVTEFERVNAFFQATDIEANEVVRELNLYYNSLSCRVYDSSVFPCQLIKLTTGQSLCSKQLHYFLARKMINILLEEFAKRTADAIQCFQKQLRKSRNAFHLQRTFFLDYPFCIHLTP